MRILIAGVGEVGANIAREIEGGIHEIVLVDLNDENLRQFSGKAGIETYHGDISTLPYFRSQGQKPFDMFFAITESDEVNMVACSMAKRFKVDKTVCRMQKMFGQGQGHEGLKSTLGIDYLVNPIQILVDRLMEVYSAPNLFDHFSIFDGRLNIFGFHVRPFCSVKGRTLEEINSLSEEQGFGVSFLIRDRKVLFTDKLTKAEDGDCLYFHSAVDKLESIRHFLGYAQKKLRRVAIIGGGRIGLMLAMRLEKLGVSPIVAESNPERCRFLASMLMDSTVLNIDGTDKQTMINERLNLCDFLLALTNKDAINIIACQHAADLGIGGTVCLVQEAELARILFNTGSVLAALSPRLTMKNFITNLFPNTLIKLRNSLNVGDFQITEAISGALTVPATNLESIERIALFQKQGNELRRVPFGGSPTKGLHTAYISRIPSGHD